MPSDPIPFDPHRFRTAAQHYRAGRVPYPPALIRRVAQAMPLGEEHRVLDLGCGPGQLAIGFGYFAAEVLGLDPEPRMLAAAAEAAQGLTPNVSFRQGSSYDLGPHLGRFHLVTMGRSFHWMDRADTLSRLDGLIESGGVIALFRDAHLDVPQNAWRKQWREITDRYASDDLVREQRRAGTWLPHESFLLASAFSRLERVSLIAERLSTTESLIDRALSMSSVSRARIGERADQLVEELGALLAEVAPEGTASEVIEWSALIARRG
ncbi:MAG TPA: class I SAM-dependent methyltransferase [Acetobacteraceae bacterium]|jgi:SAM-dependent methyltransferase|nr:class I SAM-dependent methyltransferase [Acetobacteraceae bacterium]